MQKEHYNYNHRVVYDNLINRGLNDGEAKYVVNKISNELRQRGDFGNWNNFRLSVNGKQDIEYDEMRKSGCCGFTDVELILNSGKTVKFGFNYGH